EIGRTAAGDVAVVVLPRRMDAAVRPNLDAVSERAHVLQVVVRGIELDRSVRKRDRHGHHVLVAERGAGYGGGAGGRIQHVGDLKRVAGSAGARGTGGTRA